MNSAECQRVAANVAMAARLAHLERRLTGAAGRSGETALSVVSTADSRGLPGAPEKRAAVLEEAGASPASE